MTGSHPAGGFSITSEPRELGRLRAWLRAELAASRVGPGEQSALLLAVVELCANSIRHAYQGRGGEPIRVRVGAHPDRVEVEVEDWGQPFAPATYLPPDLDALPERGLGLHLVRSVADAVAADVDRGRGTRWVLVKFRAAAGSGAA